MVVVEAFAVAVAVPAEEAVEAARERVEEDAEGVEDAEVGGEEDVGAERVAEELAERGEDLAFVAVEVLLQLVEAVEDAEVVADPLCEGLPSGQGVMRARLLAIFSTAPNAIEALLAGTGTAEAEAEAEAPFAVGTADPVVAAATAAAAATATKTMSYQNKPKNIKQRLCH